MKKLTAFLLGLTMVCSFASCSSSETPSQNDAQETVEEELATVAPTDTPVPTDTPTPTPTDVPEETQEEAASYFASGEIVDDVYVNEEFNIRIELPSGWRYATEREQAAIGYYSNELYEDRAAAIENGEVITDLYMIADYGGSLNFNFSRLYGDVTAEELSVGAVDILPLQLQGVIDVDNISSETFLIDGVTYYGLDISGIICNSDTQYYQRQIYLTTESGLTGTITLGTTDADVLDVIYDIVSGVS